MVRLSYNPKDRSLTIIDESESTAGMSRQISAFRQYIHNAMRIALQNKIAELEKKGVNHKDPFWALEISKIFQILPNNHFEWVKAEAKDGLVINTYKLTGDE